MQTDLVLFLILSSGSLGICMKLYPERGGCMQQGWGAQGRPEGRRREKEREKEREGERRGVVGLNEKWVHNTARSMSEKIKNGFYPSFPF